LLDRDRGVLSRNFYWLARDSKRLRALATLPSTRLDLAAVRRADGGLAVTVRNASSGVVLGAKLSVVSAAGQRLLPVYFSDNYLDLAPGETRTVTVADDGTGLLHDAARLTLRGWNAAEASVAIGK
jgi:hypothetical protein